MFEVEGRVLPLDCDECGIEKGWPCSFLDPNYDAQHGEKKAEWCALEKARQAGLVIALVPAADVTTPARGVSS